MEIIKFKGLVAAPFTPFDERDKLNVSLIPDYYRFLEKNGVSGAFINGTTGEGASLTQKEKQRSAEAWAQELKQGGKMRIINLVGGTCYEECIENAVHSKECGISAIALVAPYYFKPDEGNLAEFISRVGESVPGMPVYFYHMPELTGVNLSVIDLLKRVSLMLPNFAGIKYTGEDLMDFLSCLNYENGKYDLLWGRDECILSSLEMGCRGAVGSTYNYAAPLYHSLIAAYDNGDIAEARRLQQVSADIVRLLEKYGGIATGKAFMKYIGFDCGKFRLPVRNMADEKYYDFVEDINQHGIDQFFSGIV